MADLIDKLEHIVGRKLDVEKFLQDDGSGAYIAAWNAMA